MSYIEDQLTSALTLVDLARRTGFSPYHFHRMFLAMVGEPVMEYIRQRRLTRAAYELVNRPQLRILDVAVEYQFQSQEVFTRAFRKAYGVTPGDYRRRGVFLPLRERADLDSQGVIPSVSQRREDLPRKVSTLFERVHATFLAVTDLERSVRWYSEKLGLEVMESWPTGADLRVYNDQTMLSLIQAPESRPTHFVDFKAGDLALTREALRSRGVSVPEIIDGIRIKTFQFYDPDGHSFGVWWDEGAASTSRGPLFDRIESVFLPVRDLDRALDWYQRTLGLTLVHHWGEGAHLQVLEGETLLTLVQQEHMEPRGMVHEAAQAPHFNLKVSNIRRCRRWLRSHGVPVTDLLQNPYIYCFNFWDLDGNLIGVCYEKPSSPFYTR